ncbi:MAG TPA: NADP-dependent oxidoreductase [Anaerolineae bacterium]|nr:NADP-dependent oxidoreductase [Anaerolineae bacterium]
MTNQTMQAARIHDYGGAEQIKIGQVERPTPQAGQVLVRLKAAGVNPADWKYRSGMFKQYVPLLFPWIPGIEGAGVIEAVGPDVKSLKVGQRVFGPINNSYAEYAVVPETELVPAPEGLSFEQLAAVPIGALTAWQAVIEEAEIKAGQTVLIHGGAGGVGAYALQLAHWKGAHVIATASAANADFVRSLGAETVIDYQKTKFEDVVKDVDAVIDTVGGDLVERSMRVIKPGGIFVTVAARVDPEVGDAHNIRATSSRRADAEKLKQIAELLASKQLVPVVGKTFPLSQAREAQELSQTGHGRGRIILVTG